MCQFFGLKQSSSLSDFVLAGEQFCNKDLSTLRQMYPNRSDDDFSRYCFSSAYIVALLHDSLGVPLDDKRQEYHGTSIFRWNSLFSDLICLPTFKFKCSYIRRIECSNQVGDIQVEWALGAFISNIKGVIVEPSATGRSAHRSRPLLAVLLGVFLLGGALCLARWRKPKTKIIYDLEKGRYIITRISWRWPLCRGITYIYDRNRCLLCVP